MFYIEETHLRSFALKKKDNMLQEIFKLYFYTPEVLETRKFSLCGIFVLYFCSQRQPMNKEHGAIKTDDVLERQDGICFFPSVTSTASPMGTEAVEKIYKLRDFKK